MKDEPGEILIQSMHRIDGIKHAKEELLWILKMLMHVSATDECIRILNKMKDDLEARGYPDVFHELVQDSSNSTLKPMQ